MTAKARGDAFKVIRDTMGRLAAGESMLQQREDKIEQMHPLYLVGFHTVAAKVDESMIH
jgi:hypothetical protein